MPELEKGPKVELPLGLTLQSTLQVKAGNINEIAWSPDGRTLASGDPDGVIGLWDVESGIQRARLERSEKVVWSVAFSPDGARVASGSNDGSIGLYDSSNGRLLECLERHDGWVRSVAWSPDGASLASGANDRTVILWDLASRSQRRVLEGHRERVLSLRFSPDGSQIASAGGDGQVVIWNANTGEAFARHQITGGWQRGIAWSPDGRLVAVGAEDGAVRLLRSQDGRLAAVLEGHREGVGCVSFDATGQLLASRSVDGRIRLWTPSRGSWRLLARFKEPASFPMANMAFHPSQMSLATVAQARIRIWQVELEKLRSSAEGQKATRLFTTKVAVVGGAAASELTRALATPLLGEHHPEVSLLESREEEHSGAIERREILLFNLGKAAPRMTELDVLHLRDCHAVLVAFDPLVDADPGQQIRTCATQLARLARLEKRAEDPLLFAVAIRPLGRRGEDTSIAAGRLDLSLLDLPLAGLLVAEPGSPRQLQRLRDALTGGLEDMPSHVPLESAATLSDVESLILEEARHDRQLITTDDLLRCHFGRDQAIDDAGRALFDACLRQLELRGQLRRLRLGQLLCSPRLFEAYCRALLLAATTGKEAGQPGELAEELALEGELPALQDGLQAPALDRLLRVAILAELIELGIASKTSKDGQTWLSFPRATPSPVSDGL